MTHFDEANAAAQFLRGAIGAVPEVALVLGSGLGAFASSLAGASVVPYERIPHWPMSRVIGHEGRLVAGSCRGRRSCFRFSPPRCWQCR